MITVINYRIETSSLCIKITMKFKGSLKVLLKIYDLLVE
jgi:hypothetical protein